MTELDGNKDGKRISVLLYHQIGEFPGAYTNLDCFCTSENFYQQMLYLKKSEYKVVSLQHAIDSICNRKKENYVVLTFDDGCEKFHSITYPILKEFNFPATIYPVVGCLGSQASWGTIKNPDLKILSKSTLIELDKLGLEIGSHTVDHPKLTQITRESAISQIKNSKDILEQILGHTINSFAYPHGDLNNDIIEIVKETGFNNALTCLNNYANEAKSIYEIPRRYITYHDDLEKFKQILL